MSEMFVPAGIAVPEMLMVLAEIVCPFVGLLIEIDGCGYPTSSKSKLISELASYT